MSRLRLAARLARRELARHPWRTLLAVVIMIIPVMAVQGVVLTWHAVDAGNRTREDARLDGADYSGTPGEIEHFVDRGLMPAPTRTASTFTLYDHLVLRSTSSGGTEAEPELKTVTVIGAVPDSPRVRLISGRLPRNSGEVAVNADARQVAHSTVGDTVELAQADVRLDVVGEVEVRDLADEPALVVGLTAVTSRDSSGASAPFGLSDSSMGLSQQELYWFAPGSDWEARLAAVQDTFEIDAFTESTARAASLWASAVAFAGGAVGIIAVICSVAFTIGSRRRLRSLGMLGASGAAPADLGLTVMWEGLWCGALASVTATAASIALWATVGTLDPVRRLLAEGLMSPPHPYPLGWVAAIALVCLIIGPLAAALPAKTAARTPVLAALGGRRPLPRVKTRVPLTGLILFLGGTGVIARSVMVSRRGDSFSELVIVLAGLAVVFGGVATAPAIVALFGVGARRARGVGKLALRSLARERTRYAAVVAAAAVAMAPPAVALAARAQHHHQAMLTAPTLGRVDIDASADTLREVVPQARAILGEDVVELHGLPLGHLTPESGALTPTGAMVVTPQAAEALFPGTPVAEHLRRGDAVMVRDEATLPTMPTLDDQGQQTADLTYEMPPIPGLYRDGVPRLVDVDIAVDRAGDPGGVYGALTGELWQAVLVTPEVFADGQLAMWQRSTILIRPTPITADEAKALEGLGRDEPTLADIRGTAGGGGTAWDAGRQVFVWTNRPGPDRTGLVALGLAAASTLVALAIVLVALALAAADGRDDERLYVALGGPPGLLRRKHTLEAALLTATAGILGIGLGMVPTLAVMWAGRGSDVFVGGTLRPPGYDDLPFPIVDLLAYLVIATLVIAALVWLIQALGGLRARRDLVLLDG